ncbi:MAG: hypothetical protein JW863_22455 [Chitinispirillaceae bacterium]|nr:hypothetical protein [Chitinispirillaceae bacterium]
MNSSPPINSTNLPAFLFSMLIACVLSVVSEGQPLPPGDLSVSGANEFRFADGYDISYDFQRPWRYLTNATDLTAGFRSLYLKLRFDVQEPSMGFNPPEPVYREYLSHRTLGFTLQPFTIEAGHVATQFGRGLTLSCKEDREIEQYSLIDGVYGRLQFPLFTLQGIAGRPYEQRNAPLSLSALRNWNEEEIMVQQLADMRLRDLIAGTYAEFFFPVEKLPLRFLTSGSIAAGIVRYSSEVGPVQLAYRDTVNYEDPFWHQERQEMYFPSGALNLTFGNYSFSIENAMMTGRVHGYANSMDTSRGAFDSVYTVPRGYASYVSANALFAGITFLAEYKNYYYDETTYLTEETASYLIPPSVRYGHTWHLLNKHLLPNLMGNSIGYNFTASYSPADATLLTANFNCGGRHDADSRVRIKSGSAYWDAYGEWSQEIGELIDFRIGVDYGKIDPEFSKVTYRTLAADIDFGPLRNRHSFGLTFEGQLNDKPFFAEQSIDALKDLIVRLVPADSLSPFINPSTGDTLHKDTLLYDYLVAESDRSKYTQYALNLLTTLSYGFSPWFIVSVTLEHEVALETQDYIHVVSDISSKIRNYASIGISAKPFPNHEVTLEYGSMSGGKKCTLGTCVDLPPFKGFKVTLVSRF